MAKVLKQAVVQYDLGLVPQRMVVQFVDDVTNEETQEVIYRDDMENPDSNIFDNFKAMVEKFMV